jgi:hypothetical protein
MSGKSSPTIIESPAAPAAPSYSATVKDYVDNYPQLVALQKQYSPELAALDKQINEQLYPQTAGLQENLAQQANQGMTEGLPQDIRNQYVSDFNAGLGMNANAPLGISDRNVALTKLNEQWKNYYQNLGLSAAGRQPLATGTDTSSGLQGALNYATQNYGTTMQGYGSSLANRIVQPNSSGFSGSGALSGIMINSLAGNPIGAVGGGLLGGFSGGF